MSPKAAFSCINCNKKDDQEMVCCDNCDSWLHYTCAGVTSAVADVDWRCETCRALLATALIDSQQINTGKSGAAEQTEVLATLHVERTVHNVAASSESNALRPEAIQKDATRRPVLSPKNAPSCGGSCSSRLRKQWQLKFVEEEQALIKDKEDVLLRKESLLQQRRMLLEQLEEDNDRTSEEETEVPADLWSKTRSRRSKRPQAESTATMQTEAHVIQAPVPPSSSEYHSTLNELLRKVHALELQITSPSKEDQSTTHWLPDMITANNIPSGTTGGEVGMEHRSTRRLTREQIAARTGISKDLPKFTGKPDEWPLFLASFEQTTALCGFSDDENLIRLREALDGTARYYVKNLLLHSSCVPQILQTLRMKFGRPELIIDVLLAKVRDLPALKENRLDTIVDFAIEVQNICATMKASGMISYLNNPELEQELVSRLPGLLGAFWGMHKSTLNSSNLEHFSSWLFHLAQGANSVLLPSTSTKAHKRGNTNIHTVSDFQSIGCIICKGPCLNVESCETFVKMQPEKRWNKVREFALCCRCLKPHSPTQCEKTTVCNVTGCRSLHHPILHKKTNDNDISRPVSDTNQFENNSSILFRILPVILHANGVQVQTYAFFDDGSSLTLLDGEISRQLNLKGTPQPLCMRWTAGTHRYEDNSMVVNLEISGSDNRKRFSLNDVHTVQNLGLPLQSIYASTLQTNYKHLRGIPLKSYSNAEPKLLIGLNNSKLGLSLRQREGGLKEPIAEKTRLGWTVKGPLPEGQNLLTLNKHHVFHACSCDATANMELLKIVKDYIFLDNLGLQTSNSINNEDQIAMKKLQAMTVRVGCHYETGLLWKNKKFSIPNSFPMAEHRALCLVQRMQRDPELAEGLQLKIEEYLFKGYARKLSPSEIDVQLCWYLPIFPVHNPSKPKKMRIVWDAAAKVNGISLNSMLLKGPDQLTPLVTVLRRFRQRRVAISGDIADMFHQVRMRMEDQQFQRFLWFDPGERTPSTYVMKVMTFGATCSPSCAQYVKNSNAKEFSHQYPRAVECITDSHYVDDMLDSVDTEEEAITLAAEVRHIHAKGGFHIRNWMSNSTTVLRALNTEPTSELCLNMNDEMGAEKVLGMWWDTRSDCFVFKVSKRYKNSNVVRDDYRPTKRELLSFIMSLFDPLGLLGFYTMYAKIIFQETWRTGCTWDEPINDDQFVKWRYWIRQLPEVEKINIPRCYVSKNLQGYPDMELHTFVDASENGYAAVSYLRGQENHTIMCCLVGCKTKVAPLKCMSIPRLELQAALLGARLAEDIQKTHSINISRKIFWSDSRTVIAWLQSDHRRYKQFVAFRVSEILELSDMESWNWIPSSENVADEATKWQHCPDFSTNSRWFNGPSFLKVDQSQWPQQDNKIKVPTTEELRTQYVGQHVEVKQVKSEAPKFGLLQTRYRDFSSWQRLLRSTAAVVHIALFWKKKTLESVKNLQYGHISQDELKTAELLLWKAAQYEAFSAEIDSLKNGTQLKKSSPLYQLSPYMDKSGILRLEGRIHGQFECNPVILPKDHHITYLIVFHVHCKYHHGSHETVINELRQIFWIPRLRAVLNSTRRKCQECSNNTVQPHPPRMGPLPPARIAPFCRPFSYVGVDYFGPLYVTVRRSSEKRYGVLFTCMTTRAVHIEVAYSLSSDSCILTIRNFIGRRGSPIEFYSDNGTNFRGAERELAEAFAGMDKNLIVSTFTSSSTKWQFIPPSSPHMGGAWERLVRSVKSVLYKVLLRHKITDELLRAALIEVEMIINSRPLTYVPIHHENDEALTPNHFLLGSSNGAKPLIEAGVDGVLLRKNWLTSQQIANTFWKRWLVQYLPTITRRTKWFEEVKPIGVGDIVYIVDPDQPRNCWPRGKVISVAKGQDGRVRSASVQTTAGVYNRPAAKIAVLDVADRVEPCQDIPGGTVTEHLAAPTANVKQGKL